jgi:AraC family transcriptional activator of pobA
MRDGTGMDGNGAYLYFSGMSLRAHRRSIDPDAARHPRIPAFFLYGEPLRPPDEGTVHIETIAARSRPHDWNIGAHRHHDLHQLLVLRRGRVALRLDDLTARRQGPALVIVPAGTVHAFRFEAGTAGWVVTFAGGLARGLVAPADGLIDLLDRPLALGLARTAHGATDLLRLARMLHREFARSAPGRAVMLRGLLAALLGNVLRVASGDRRATTAPQARDRELVARFRGAIERRYREHASIAAYVKDLEVSESRLRRACARAAGQRPIELVHHRLLIEAERELRYTSLPVSRIAYQLGFEDPAYFTRFFTRGTGTSPSAFRPGRGRYARGGVGRL